MDRIGRSGSRSLCKMKQYLYSNPTQPNAVNFSEKRTTSDNTKSEYLTPMTFQKIEETEQTQKDMAKPTLRALTSTGTRKAKQGQERRKVEANPEVKVQWRIPPGQWFGEFFSP